MSGYISKDFVHAGCGLPFEPERVWDEVPYSVRKNINKAMSAGLSAERVAGSPEHIEILRSMWYDPEDPNMPHSLRENEFMFIARNPEGKPLGATILLPVGNHLFLNNLAGSHEGKQLRVQDFLLWHIVNYFAGSQFKYLDVGVSYRPSLYKFFTKWQVISYPVIFNKPEFSFPINKFPFSADNFKTDFDEKKAEEALNKIKQLTGIDKITFVPDEKHAKIITVANGAEYTNMTFGFPAIPAGGIYALDLKQLFPVQFGFLLFGLEISDADMWNKYHCLDVFKRNLVMSQIYEPLGSLPENTKRRLENYKLYEQLFSLDGIAPLNKLETIPSLFYFRSDLNARYHSKLFEFDIDHYYCDVDESIGLPVHQNLNRHHIEYIYGIFRGILNLCSEWEHTDNYDKYK